jgi:hypothetical protein
LKALTIESIKGFVEMRSPDCTSTGTVCSMYGRSRAAFSSPKDVWMAISCVGQWRRASSGNRVAIRSHSYVCNPVAIICNQMQSDAVRCNQMPSSEAIRSHQIPSDPIRSHQWQSEANQSQSEAIRANQRPSKCGARR